MWLQPRVQAGDLSSHLYNTWLVLLVKSGEPLGLEIVPQYSNVLFDWWLEGFWRLGGPVLAEKAGVSLAVMIFFWGSFALLRRLTGQSPWPSAPLLAMLAYGWVFHQGFFNYYLSCAFGFWGIVFLASQGRKRLLALPMLALACLGHLLGAAVAAGLGLYLALRQMLGERRRLALLMASLLGLALTGWLIGVNLPAKWNEARMLQLTGVTPFLIDSLWYLLPVTPLLLLWLTGLVWKASVERLAMLRVPAADLAFLCAAAIALMPTRLRWPGTEYPLYFIDWRLGLWYVLCLHALLAGRLPARFVGAVCATAAGFYFCLLALDNRSLSRIEQSFHEVVRRAPPRSRVVSGLTAVPEDLNPINHMLDRACIGYCFSYANYESATGQFRLRAKPGSTANLDSLAAVSSLHAGRYRIRAADVPIFAVSRRPGPGFALEIREIAVGETIRKEVLRLPLWPR
ncbi:MAG: hypothetical protein ACP5UT_11580 [Bryobacteraceae bacterium]